MTINMYTYTADTGEVTRDSDGVVVSPCQSADDPDFVTYQEWALAGGELNVVATVDNRA